MTAQFGTCGILVVKMLCDTFEVIHQQFRLFENIGVDPLKDITLFSASGPCEYPDRVIDVTAAVIAE
jgi:hypothetical protein